MRHQHQHQHLWIVAVVVLAVSLVSCRWQSEDVTREQQDVTRQQEQYTRNQPPPTFDFSYRRYLMTQLYQIMNTSVATYSVVQSEYTGKILTACPSIGYPIPATTQLTNPERIVYSSGGTPLILPQPEPDGLYSPSNTEATYIMCVGDDGRIEPRYEERKVSTFLRPMEERDGQLVPVAGHGSAASIDPRQQQP